MSDNIKVSVRFRPLIAREQGNKLVTNWSCQEDKEVIQVNPAGGTIGAAYIFDRVFDERETTQDLYDEICEPIVDAAMQGFHGTIFAYGQTSSGKTFTMCGSKFQAGIISLAMDQVFQSVEETPDREFLLRCSFLEIYNEKLGDLLMSNGEKTLKLHEDTDHNVGIANLTEEYVKSTEEVITLMDKGNTRRHTGETVMNEHSSRSHAIFRMVVESRHRQAGENEAVMVAHLNFVDLAGSEKASENSGDRLKEGCAINKSLFHLSHVISKLSEGVGHAHVNYRDSKLTRILQNALGGNSKTAIICTVTPASVAETHSTLRFASSAKVITNKPKVNEVVSDAAQMKRYRKEIEQLKKVIAEMGVMDVQLEKEDLQKRLEEKEACQTQQEDLIGKLKQMICVSSLPNPNNPVPKKRQRRETWCIGKLKRQRSSISSLSASMHTPGSARNRIFSGLPCTPSNNVVSQTIMEMSPDDEVEEFLSASQAVFEEPLDSPDAPLQSRRVAFNIFPSLNSHMDKEVQTAVTETRHQDVQTTECLSMSSTVMTVETGTQMIAPPDNQVESGDLEQVVQISEQLLLDKGALEAQRGALEACLVTKQNEIDAMTHNNMTVTDHLTALMVHQADLQKDYDELVEHTRLEREFSMNNSSCTEDLGKIVKLREELISLQRSSSDAQAVTMEISKQLSLERDSNKNVQAQLDKVEKQLEQITNEKSDFDILLEMEKSKRKRSEAELRQELQTLYARDRGGSSMAESGSNNIESSSSLLLESKEAEITQLRESIARLESERDCLREALQESANQETEIYHKQLKDADANAELLQAQIAEHIDQHSKQMEASIAELEAVKEQHAADISKLQTDFSSIQEQHGAESEKLMQELRFSKQLHGEEIAQLTAKFESEAAHMVSELESKVVDLTQLNVDLENSRTTLDHQLESLRTELELVRERHIVELAELTERLSTPISDSVELQTELDRKSEELETTKQLHCSEIERLQKELELTVECHREELQQQLIENSKSVSNLSSTELEDVNAELKCKTEELERLKLEFESVKKQHALEIEEIQDVINMTNPAGLAGQALSLHDELQSGLKQDNPEVIELQHEVECKSAEISELNTQIDTLKQNHLVEIEELSNNLESERSEIESGKSKEQSASSRCSGEEEGGNEYVSKHDIDVLHEKMEGLENELSSQKDRLSAMMKERDGLQMENMKLKSTFTLQTDIDENNCSRRYSDEVLSNQFAADQSLLDRSCASTAESTTALITRGIAESVARITDMEGEISRLHNELKNSRDVEEMLEESLHGKEIEIKKLMQQCCSLDEEVKRQKSIIDTFNVDAEKQLQTAEAALEECTASLESVKIERNEALSKNVSLQERVDYFVSEEISLRELVDKKVVEIDGLRSETIQLINERDSLKDENVQMAESLECVRAENVRVINEKQSLEDERNQLVSETDVLREEKESMKYEVNTSLKHTCSNDDTKSEQANLEQLHKQFEYQLDTITREKTDIEEKYIEKCEELSTLIEQHRELVRRLEEEKQVLSEDLAGHKDQLTHLEEVRMTVECLKEEKEELVRLNEQKVSDLEKALVSEHERKLGEVQSSIEHLEEERAGLLLQINEKKEVSAELGELRTSVVILKQENQNLVNMKTSEVASLQCDIESFKAEKIELESMLKQQTDLQKEYQLEAETLKNAASSQEADLASKMFELEQEVRVLREKLRSAESDDESESLKSHIKYLEKLNEQLQNSHEEDQDIQLEKLQKKCDEIEELRQELLQKGEAILEYMEKDDEAQSKIQELMESAVNDQMQIEQQNLKLEDAQESLAAISAEKESLKGKALTLAEEYGICKTQYCSTMDEVEMLKCKLSETELSLEEYKEKHSLASTELEILRQNTKDGQSDEIAKINEQVEMRENRINELERKLEELTGQIDTLVKDNESLCKHREEDKISQEKELSSKILEYQTMYERLTDECHKCKEQIEMYENERLELEDKLASMKNQNQTSREELTAMDEQRRREITELNQQRELERESDMQKLEQQRSDFQEELGSLREELELKDAELAESRRLQEEASKSMTRTDDRKTEPESQDVKVDESGCDASNTEVIELKATIEELKESLHKKKIQHLEELCNKSDVERQCNKLKLHLQISMENTQEATAKVTEREERVDKMNAELSEEKGRVEALKLEIVKLKKQQNTPVVQSSVSLSAPSYSREPDDQETQKLQESLEGKTQQLYNNDLKLRKSQQRVTSLEEHITFLETKLGHMKTEFRRVQQQSNDVTICHPSSGSNASVDKADKEVQVQMESSSAASTPSTEMTSDYAGNVNPGRSGIVDSFCTIVLQHKIDKLEKENQRLRRARSTRTSERQSIVSSATTSASESITSSGHSLLSSSRKSDIEQLHTITPLQAIIPGRQSLQTPLQSAKENAKDILTSAKTTLTEINSTGTKTPITDSTVFKTPVSESTALSDKKVDTGSRVTRLKTGLGLDGVKVTTPVIKRPLEDVQSQATQANKIQNCGKASLSSSSAFQTSHSSHSQSLLTSSASKPAHDLTALAESSSSRVTTRGRLGMGSDQTKTSYTLGSNLAEQKIASAVNARKTRQSGKVLKEMEPKEQCKQQ